MTPETIMAWLRANELERRRVIAIVLGGLAIQALTAANHRALFMPWLDAEHPLVSPTPSAFFARVPSVGAGLGTGQRVASLSGLRRPIGSRGDRGDAGTPGGGAFDLTPANPIDGVFDPGGLSADGLSQSAGLPDGPGGAGPGLTPAGASGAPAAFDTPGAVPETTTWLMMLIGFAGIGGAIRRARRNAASAQRQAIALDRDAAQAAQHILAQ